LAPTANAVPPTSMAAAAVAIARARFRGSSTGFSKDVDDEPLCNLRQTWRPVRERKLNLSAGAAGRLSAMEWTELNIR
jgi:hypothetical protein